MTTISTHVLDLASGGPGRGIDVTLESVADGVWTTIASATTDADGRVGMLGSGLAGGHYRIRFATGGYGNGFFPEVAVVCDLDEGQDHYHVPLLLSPFGYTTYRGS